MINKTFFVSALLLFFSISAIAQIGPPAPSSTPEPPGAPIDGWVVVVFIVALFYGIYKTLKTVKLATHKDV